jgi:ATP/maltotriose-dependent transcriptional regulator MalT
MPHNHLPSWDQPLLRTKISIPQIPSEFVHRPRLTAQIDRGVRGPLTLLSAPAGYAKTNLLLEWVEQTDLPLAWLTIDNDDNDLGRFYRYMIGALQTLEPGCQAFQARQTDSIPVGMTEIAKASAQSIRLHPGQG